MPAEPISVLLRPRNFFARNPALDVPPVRVRTPGEVLRGVVAGNEGGVVEAEAEAGCCAAK